MAQLGVDRVHTLESVSDPLQTMNIAEEMDFQDGFATQTTVGISKTLNPSGLG